jgi:hypothetical protein
MRVIMRETVTFLLAAQPDSFRRVRLKTDNEVLQLTSNFPNTRSCKLVEDNLSLKSYSQGESKYNTILQVFDSLANLTKLEMCVCIHFNVKRFCCVAYGGWACRATFCCALAVTESLCRQIGTTSSLVVLGLVPCATAARAQMTTHWARSISAAPAAPRPTAFQPKCPKIQPLRQRRRDLASAVVSPSNHAGDGIAAIG